MQLLVTNVVEVPGGSGMPSIIPPIKAVRAVTGLGLKEAKVVVDNAKAGIPSIITANSASDVDHLASMGITACPLDAASILRNALERLPRHLTVAEVLAVLDATGV